MAPPLTRLTDAIALPSRDLSALGRCLAQHGLASPRRLLDAETEATRRGARPAEVFRLSLSLPARQIAEAEAELLQTAVIDPVAEPPALNLLTRYGAELCLRNGILPWQKRGTETIILSSRPEQFGRHRDALIALFGPVRMAITTEELLQDSIRARVGATMAKAAETRVPDQISSRTWNGPRFRNHALTLLCVALTGLVIAPVWIMALLTGWAVLTMVLSSALKLAAGWIHLRKRPDPAAQDGPVPARLPVVTVLVPLFKERAIASHLLARLNAIDYPRTLLDVCLVLEEDDDTTRKALTTTNLPRWMRAIVVPQGFLKTKPRAFNYALNFARGSIIGVYDAEDAPAPDQIHTVVNRFAQRGPEVACLQGILDFYNSGSNWLARCFTLEYATWFRVMLPGLERMGLVIPLGGTTLFFRRETLEKIGAWDAHNVTEDADLGLRLARMGYRTELIRTVTEEEANCRAWPWVKQRSRWLKGYAITYGVHMRDPRQLLHDLGWWRFLGVQLLFAGTLSQFALAPVLWSFWLVPLGFGHPLQGLMPHWCFLALGLLFAVSEIINIGTAAMAVRDAGKRWLMIWAPTLHLYFPLACIASYKGLGELFTRPFYWDKTAHGIFAPTPAVSRSARPPAHPASGG